MDVFLSHSTADKKLAERLTKGLEGQGLSVWFDGHELSPGSDWRHEIEEAIHSAKNVVLLIDRHREPDDVQDFTWRAALEAAWQDARKRLIPVLRRGAELPKFVLSGSSGKAVPIVRLEDARALRGVVESIVQLANGKASRRARVHADRESGGHRPELPEEGLTSYQQPGERKQRLDEIERYAKTLK